MNAGGDTTIKRRQERGGEKDNMSDVLSPQKMGRGWIMDVPPEMAAAMGVDEGSVIVLYPREGGMSYEILPPLSPDIQASVLQTCEEFKEAFAEMKRLGDLNRLAISPTRRRS